tara:strand:+ start:843 stop:2009 length:1167 start_codon:yes stop_codon:yes gene_type:complete
MKNKKKLIIGITGIRSEYDIMSSVFKEIKKSQKLNLKLIVTGAHLSKKYGYTVNEILKDGFKIAHKFKSLQETGGLESRAIGLGLQVKRLAKVIKNLSPDFILVLGDREESMTAGIISAYLNIPLIHIGGGDRVVGNIDDQIRHSVTKLAHIHIVTNKESKKRVLNLGEQAFRVFNFGNPGLDRFLNTPDKKIKKIPELRNFILSDDEKYLVLIQHPLSSEFEFAPQQMKITLDAIKEVGMKTLIIYPNSDVGSSGMIKMIQSYQNLNFVKIIKNIPRNSFINILRKCSCLLGNSSCGILEAPILKIPVINIGNRQKARLHARNVIFVDHNKKEIINALNYVMYNKKYRRMLSNVKNPYGDGKSSKKIVKLIEKIDINKKLLIKDITY